MHNLTVFLAALAMTAVVSIGFDVMAASKNEGVAQTMAEAKKCKKGYTYSESKGKCVRKGGYKRPDKS
jgi:hypothetical protein